VSEEDRRGGEARRALARARRRRRGRRGKENVKVWTAHEDLPHVDSGADSTEGKGQPLKGNPHNIRKRGKDR
jgi:hypothetical protein